MLKALKTRVYPCPEQAAYLERAFGSCRFVYNWALERKIEAYQNEGKTIGKY
ncbi:MAG: helix-turn-helix domain-containing protein, partial [Spirochaetaceae bacterium]|nr:helix-turn-helix domain-containing protein [Spirochaetaceae bacterium]